MSSRPFSFFTLFLIVFVGLVGVTIAIPVLAPLLLDTTNQFLPASADFQTRTIILGLLLGSYPLAQFLGAPVLGIWSDHIGRKPALLVSMIGSFVGYVLFAIGIITHELWLLFFSRILDGFTGGNISIVNSAIADVTEQKDKAKRFGMIGMAFGLGFIIGPVLGGVLSDSTISPWLTSATPFWVAAAISLLDIFLIIFAFRETLKTSIKQKISIWLSFIHLKKASKHQTLKVMFVVVFLLAFAFTFFTQFWQVYLIEKFQFTESQIGIFFAYIGLWVALAQGFLIRPISKKYPIAKIISWSIFGLAATLLLVILPQKSFWLYLIMPFMAISNGLLQPNQTAFISNLQNANEQGETLGILQSIQSLAFALPPLLGGFIVAMNIYLPNIIATVLTLVAGVIFVWKIQKKPKDISSL